MNTATHNRKRTTFRGLSCPVDAKRCGVLAILWPALCSVAQAGGPSLQCVLKLAVKHLPCEHCRQGEETIRGLAGVRLGRRERGLLLRMAPPDAQPAELNMAGDTRSQRESKLRALRKLARCGLVTLRWRQEGRTRMRMARRTVVGQALTELLGDALRTGRSIRWADHMQPLIVLVRKGDCELLHMLRERIADLLAGCNEALDELGDYIPPTLFGLDRTRDKSVVLLSALNKATEDQEAAGKTSNQQGKEVFNEIAPSSKNHDAPKHNLNRFLHILYGE